MADRQDKVARFLSGRVGSLSSNPKDFRSFGDNVGSHSAKRIEKYLDIQVSKKARSIAKKHLERLVYQYPDFGTYGMKLISETHKNKICFFEWRLQFEINNDVVTTTNVPLSFVIDATSEECHEKPILIVPVSIYEGGVSHLNTLLIHRVHKTIEHFEPHGDKASYIANPISPAADQHVDVVLKAWVKVSLPDYKWVGRDKMCPLVKPQVEGILWGTCSVWNLWYLHVRMENPSVKDASYIIREAYGAIRNKDMFIYEFALQIAAAAVDAGVKLQMNRDKNFELPPTIDMPPPPPPPPLLPKKTKTINIGDKVYYEGDDADMFGICIRKIDDNYIEVDTTIMDNNPDEEAYIFSDDEDEEHNPIETVHIDLVTRVRRA
jgi:hypothetical protein